jgi:hypothetical protein
MTPQALPFEAQREEKRRDTNKLRVLRRLQAGPATTLELIACGGARAAARAWELKREGYPVKVEDFGGGLFKYSLEAR